MIFPTLAGKPCGYVNLDDYYAKRWLPEHNLSVPKHKSHMLDANTCRNMVECMHKKRGLEWSYGGWLENRSRLWRGSYLDHDKRYIHLGVDFNAPVGTAVACDHSGIVMKVDTDYPEPGGWGTRVMIMLDHIPIVLIFAHLMPTVKLKVGDRIRPGEQFANIGSPLENGGWYPHVHVQAMANRTYWYYESNPGKLDGYGCVDDIWQCALEFPDPVNFVRLHD